jgi:hypothetical protein
MQISGEGKLGLLLGLVALGGAGAMSAFPSQQWIGLLAISISIIGFARLGCHHFNLNFRTSSILLSATIVLCVVLFIVINKPISIDRTQLLISSKPRLLGTNGNDKFGFDLFWKNLGPSDVSNTRWAWQYRHYSQPELPKQAIEWELYRVRKYVPTTSDLSDVIPPADERYTTIYDDLTISQWNDVHEGRLNVYLFAVFKYNVNGVVKATEFCLLVRQEAPATHVCHRNGLTYISR